MSLKRSYNGISAGELAQFLEDKYLQYNNPSFINEDPVSIPHSFINNIDREVSGFLAATISWGRRDLILRSSRRLIEMMDNSPYEFVTSASLTEIEKLYTFIYRTFSGTDCVFFIKGLRNIYSRYNSMEEAILEGMSDKRSLVEGLSFLRELFFSFVKW